MILAYLEHSKDKLPKGALCVLQAALEVKSQHQGGPIVALLVGGAGTAQAAAEAAKYGADEVLYVESSELENYLSMNFQNVVQQVIEKRDPTVVMGLASSRGKDLFPRIAQSIGAGQASDCVAVLPNGAFRRPMYAGNILAEVEITTTKKVVTIRSTGFDAAPASGSTSQVSAFQASVAMNDAVKFISYETVESARPELTEASVVVSGGRAMKSAENFQQLILPLADAFGAAVGASRAAVDSGYAPNDWQVGQTGKVVAPSLYVAVGISGAIQHLAGMKDSKVIVAINKDGDAPIFEVADYGLVADLYEAIPQLTSAVNAAKGK